MSIALGEKRIVGKREKRLTPKAQKPRRIGPKKGQPFPWKMVFIAFAILASMAFLFTPNDPSAVQGGSTSGFGQGVIGR